MDRPHRALSVGPGSEGHCRLCVGTGHGAPVGLPQHPRFGGARGTHACCPAPSMGLNDLGGRRHFSVPPAQGAVVVLLCPRLRVGAPLPRGVHRWPLYGG